MKKRRVVRFYAALVTLPDRLYPFRTEVGGQWVRGIRSYRATLARYERRYGPGHYGVKLDAYRQVFHLASSILYLVIAAYLSRVLFGSEKAIYVFLLAAVAFITFQEFYLHRRMYRQLWKKGIIDWMAWCVPIGVYLYHIR